MFSGKECFLTSPAWEALRIKCQSSTRSLDKYPSELLSAFASLPNVLNGIKNTDLEHRYSLIYKAKQFKAKISKFDTILERDLENPLIVNEIPAIPSSKACMPTYYNFSIVRVAFQYCLYWSLTIIANNILMNLDDATPSLSEECQIAADNICKSIEYFRRLRPLGSLCMHLVVSTAFGVSSSERREQLVQEIQDLLPIKTGGFIMQYIFDMATGARYMKEKYY
jgi:hypothetical protein